MRIPLSALTALVLTATPAAAQRTSFPDIDTEDASLGQTSVARDRAWHPSFVLDVRNGDFARGDYDDDAANLRRVPVHLQFGLTGTLGRDADGRANAWLLLRSSNGLHAPALNERTAPRSFYESNNLVGIVVTPSAGLRTGVAYAIKTSPNGVAATTHEASVTLRYNGDDALGRLRPQFAATVRPRGGAGLYTLAGIGPQVDLRDGDDAPTLTIPAAVGVGWRGFYEAGTGDRLFAQTGLRLDVPFTAGATQLNLSAEGLALIRDRRLRRLSGPRGETSTVVPLVTIALSMAY